MVINLRDLRIDISPELGELGVKVKAAIFTNANIVNKVSALENYKQDLISEIEKLSILANPILQAYRELHEISHVKGFLPPAEALIDLIKQNKRLPNINSVVDAYNVVSAETFLSIGAHDIDKIKGNLIFKIADGSEHYISLGSKTPQILNAGEYICRDDEKVICWLDIKQCEETKITKDTKAFLIYIQGNKNTSEYYLESALEKVIENQIKFCKANPVQTIN